MVDKLKSAPLAYENPQFINTRWTHSAHPRGISGTARPLSPRTNPGYRRLLRLRALPGGDAAKKNLTAIEKNDAKIAAADQERILSAPAPPSTWPVLRRRAPPRLHAHRMVHSNPRPPPPFRGHHRRWPRNHGSRQPRAPTRPEAKASASTSISLSNRIPIPTSPPRSTSNSLFFMRKILVRLSAKALVIFPGRLRHH